MAQAKTPIEMEKRLRAAKVNKPRPDPLSLGKAKAAKKPGAEPQRK
jgi:hypothetical protein